jgi:hypothetical protein
MCELVMETERLFVEPVRILKKGEDGECHLSCRQAACLVAHVFFCCGLPQFFTGRLLSLKMVHGLGTNLA